VQLHEDTLEMFNLPIPSKENDTNIETCLESEASSTDIHFVSYPSLSCQRRCQLKYALPVNTGNASRRGVCLEAELPGDETLPAATLTVSMISGYETN